MSEYDDLYEAAKNLPREIPSGLIRAIQKDIREAEPLTPLIIACPNCGDFDAELRPYRVHRTVTVKRDQNGKVISCDESYHILETFHCLNCGMKFENMEVEL